MTRVLVDCDPGLDDALALLLVLASPELELRGVTTVAGNQTIDKTTENALKVLELAGRGDIPVASGADRPLAGELVPADDAHGETGLGGLKLPAPRTGLVEHPAVDFLAEQLQVAKEPIIVFALGPLTNIALLLALHPDAATRIARLVLMGGAIAEGNMTASAEFNIWTDPEAAARVFGGGLDVTMVGLDVTNRAVLTRADADRLRAGGTVGKAAAELLDFYLGFYEEAYEHGGAPIHDALAIAQVLRPELLKCLDRHVEIELEGICRGRTVVDMRQRTTLLEPNAHVAVDVDVATFRKLLLERIASLDGPTS
jgi:pyrimidine-specific ribonucleoside hydrolase